jgi:hypothetical protein
MSVPACLRGVHLAAPFCTAKTAFLQPISAWCNLAAPCVAGLSIPRSKVRILQPARPAASSSSVPEVDRPDDSRDEAGIFRSLPRLDDVSPGFAAVRALTRSSSRTASSASRTGRRRCSSGTAPVRQQLGDRGCEGEPAQARVALQRVTGGVEVIGRRRMTRVSFPRFCLTPLASTQAAPLAWEGSQAVRAHISRHSWMIGTGRGTGF